ncbi:hypothetical protein [Halospeciosus flavus]|uniref:hypothetical protein n=1 Tax=Halospeciosus flavus TaxID=3032283 RepID=UPI00360B3929
MVNVAILGAVTVLFAVLSPILAVATAAVGLFLVGVRGYFVPGTPRYAPALVARIPGGNALFHGTADQQSGSLRTGQRTDGSAESDDGDGGDDSDDGDELDVPEGDALLDRLVDAGVLTADDETVAPTDAFEARRREEMAPLRDADTEELADLALEFSPATESHAVRQDGQEWVALSSGATNALEETWLTRPITIAEIAGARAAADFVDDDETALAAAQTCRMFLETCPDCGTDLERGTDASCCGGARSPDGPPSETLFCPSCEAQVYTFD